MSCTRRKTRRALVRPAVYLAGVDVGHQLLALNSTLRAQVERLEELRAEKEVLRLRLLRNGLSQRLAESPSLWICS